MENLEVTLFTLFMRCDILNVKHAELLQNTVIHYSPNINTQ